jgi:hypothetical protein
LISKQVGSYIGRGSESGCMRDLEWEIVINSL